MRTLIVVAALVLVSGFVLAMSPPTSARPSPACVEGGTCPGLVCVDENLDGKFSWNECITYVCPEYGCCDFNCPPPPYE